MWFKEAREDGMLQAGGTLTLHLHDDEAGSLVEHCSFLWD